MSGKPDDAASAVAAQETSQVEGKLDGELEAGAGESGGKAQQGMDYEKAHKELQGKFSKVTEELKNSKGALDKLSAYGGVDKIVEQIEYLAGHDGFKEWAKQESRKTDYGMDTSSVDPDTQKAVELVEKIAEAKTKTQVEALKKELREEMLSQIGPVSSSVATEKMDTILDGLEDKYGDGWHEVKDVMADIIEADVNFPKIPTIKAVEAALVQALIQEGKLEGFGEQVYKKGLEAKKDMATETLGTRPDATTDKTPQTIQEAYRMAKQKHGA